MHNKRHSGRIRYIHAYFCIFRHNRHIQELFRNIQAYSESCVTDIFRVLVYMELWHIQNQKHIQNRDIFRILVCSEPWYIQNLGVFRTLAYSEPYQISKIECFVKILKGYNYVHNTVSAFHVLYFRKKYDIFNTGLIFTPELFIWCKKSMGPEGTTDCKFDVFK